MRLLSKFFKLVCFILEESHYSVRVTPVTIRGLKQEGVNCFLKISARIEGKVKNYEESIKLKIFSINRKLFLSLIPENQLVVFTKQSVLYTSKFEKQC